MYTYNNVNFGEFGFIIPIIFGTLQTIGYGTSVAMKSSSQKKYLKSEGHTQDLSYSSMMSLKEKELKARQASLVEKGKAEIYTDKRLKKLVIIITMSIIGISLAGLTAYAIGGSDG